MPHPFYHYHSSPGRYFHHYQYYRGHRIMGSFVWFFLGGFLGYQYHRHHQECMQQGRQHPWCRNQNLTAQSGFTSMPGSSTPVQQEQQQQQTVNHPNPPRVDWDQNNAIMREQFEAWLKEKQQQGVDVSNLNSEKRI